MRYDAIQRRRIVSDYGWFERNIESQWVDIVKPKRKVFQKLLAQQC
ncbi:unnamed protein product [Haemonchus placei]|uniref:Transcriptional regulator n=1 Tax=Haemonchus placei TaxID=6290 RepID=A0A0N4VSZ9_HAEPC|nr:unnamed protein product [Haemonchus placei]